MEAGPYGSLQLLAEVGKFLQKEDILPKAADRLVFKLAPFVVLISTFLLILVIPAGPDLWFIDVDTGIFSPLPFHQSELSASLWPDGPRHQNIHF